MSQHKVCQGMKSNKSADFLCPDMFNPDKRNTAQRLPVARLSWQTLIGAFLCLFLITMPAFSSEHFQSKEFECRCCHHTKMNQRLINKLEQLRSALGKPIIITSGYRCPKHNKNVGGAKHSQHMNGNAADIRIKGFKAEEVIRAAKACGFSFIKIYPSWVHVDIR